MCKVLFVIPSLEPGGAAKQLTLLAAGLPRDRFQTSVCVLGRSGPFAEPLREAGLELNVLDWRRRLDFSRFLALRRLVEDFDPDVIHVWGLPALRAVYLVAGRRGKNGPPPRRVVVSAPLPPWTGRTRIGWLDRWLLCQADRVAVSGPAEAGHCRCLGLAEDHIAVVPPAVAARETSAADGTDLRRSLGLPDAARLVICAGPLEPHKGFRDALWAYEILKYVYADLHLLVIGDGSDRRRLEADAGIGNTGGIHFLGVRSDVAGLLAQCEVVWVPSRAESGVNVALEAMAAGKPVVASRLPGLAEIVADGQTGYLVQPGAKVALARRTRLLLNDADRRRQLGEMGKERAANHFSVAALCRHFACLYESVAGSPPAVNPVYRRPGKSA